MPRPKSGSDPNKSRLAQYALNEEKRQSQAEALDKLNAKRPLKPPGQGSPGGQR